MRQNPGGTHAHETALLKIALKSPSRKLIFSGACLALTVIYIGLIANQFLADYFSTKLDLASLQLAARLEPGNSDYQYRLGHFFLQTQNEPQMATQFLKSATALVPKLLGRQPISTGL
ncbi:MAG: hypothetical protein ABSA29_05390 [Terriglobales bacterium]